SASEASLGRPVLQQSNDLPANSVEVRSELMEDLDRHALSFSDQPQQHVLGPDVVVAKFEGLAKGQLEDLLGSWREGHMAGGGSLAFADDLLDLGPYGLQRDAHRLERLARDA